MGDVTEILAAIVLAGVLGSLGQGVRVIVGLKKLHDLAAERDASSADLFVAAKIWISLMIGFVAGIVAGFSIGLQNILGLTAADSETMLGLAAAGYIGADVIEAFVPTISRTAVPALARLSGPVEQSRSSPTDALPEASLTHLSTLAAIQSDRAITAFAGVEFESLVPGGFYSSAPEDLSVRRSIRTNNPGALNISSWQRRRKGYVGVTQADRAGNVTTIYRTPEHGVAAWYHLIAERYGLKTFTLRELAVKYAGTSEAKPVNVYLTGWSRWSGGALKGDTSISVTDVAAMLMLAKAMFAHEAGKPSPLRDDQIDYGIEREIAGDLPP